ncbi:hypothetical protein CLU79DRAFT_714699 [Phycomyces nitens]|nr:hypothetical protein CLU79DRAFT_714699 [Phycomyces nitens]
MVKFSLSFIIAAVIAVAVVQVRADDSDITPEQYKANIDRLKTVAQSLPPAQKSLLEEALSKVDANPPQAKPTDAARVANAANIDAASSLSSDASVSVSTGIALATIASVLGLIALN